MTFGFLADWHAYLPREGGHVVTLRGGGGKTALLEAMTAVLSDAGVPVAIARDGADDPLDWPGLLRCPLDALREEHPRLHIVAADGGVAGLTPVQIDAIGGTLPRHVLIYETDSGAGASVVNSRAEALPGRTSLMITVCGLDAIGQSPEALCTDRTGIPETWLTELDGRSVWSWEGLIAWLDSLPKRPAGVGETPPHVAALLMMDECLDSIGLFACLGTLMEERGLSLVTMGDTSGPEPRLRTAFVQEPEANA